MVAYKYDRLKYDCDQIWLRPNNVRSNNVRPNIDIGMENLYIQAKQGRSARERSLRSHLASRQIFGFLKLAGKMLMLGLSSNKIKTAQKLVTSYWSAYWVPSECLVSV